MLIVERGSIATRRDGLIHLGHFERRHGHRPQKKRGHDSDLALDAQPVERLGHVFHADAEAEIDRREIQRADQAVGELHRAIDPMVVIFRFPAFVSVAQADRAVLDAAGEGVVLRVRQGRQIDRRLDQRADRADRVQRPVESRVTWLAPPGHGQHLALVHGGDHGRGLQGARLHVAGFFQLGQSRGQGLLDRCLHQGIEGREDIQALRTQILISIIPLQLAPDEGNEIRIFAHWTPAFIRQSQRGHLGLRGGLGRDHVIARHEIQDQVAARLGGVRMTSRI